MPSSNDFLFVKKMIDRTLDQAAMAERNKERGAKSSEQLKALDTRPMIEARREEGKKMEVRKARQEKAMEQLKALDTTAKITERRKADTPAPAPEPKKKKEPKAKTMPAMTADPALVKALGDPTQRSKPDVYWNEFERAVADVLAGKAEPLTSVRDGMDGIKGDRVYPLSRFRDGLYPKRGLRYKFPARTQKFFAPFGLITRETGDDDDMELALVGE